MFVYDDDQALKQDFQLNVREVFEVLEKTMENSQHYVDYYGSYENRIRRFVLNNVWCHSRSCDVHRLVGVNDDHHTLNTRICPLMQSSTFQKLDVKGVTILRWNKNRFRESKKDRQLEFELQEGENVY